MKIKSKRQYLTGNKMHYPGDVYDVPYNIAKLLISKGLAEKEEKIKRKTKEEKTSKKTK